MKSVRWILTLGAVAAVLVLSAWLAYAFPANREAALFVNWFGVDPEAPPEGLVFIGRTHVLLLHLPIGMLLGAILLEAANMRSRAAGPGFDRAVFTLLAAGSFFAVLSALTGTLLSFDGAYESSLLFRHQWAGVFVGLFSTLPAYLKFRKMRGAPSWNQPVYGGALLVLVAATVTTGHFGATLTHGPRYFTFYLPNTLRSWAGMPAIAKRNPDNASVYRALVEPVFEARCTSCHGSAKQKGDLRLDTPHWILDGADGQAVINPGNPQTSELYRRLILPRDDKKAMPPFGKPALSPTQLARIRWWIESGASFTNRLAEVRLPPDARGEMPDAVHLAAAETDPAPPAESIPQAQLALDDPALAAAVVLRAAGAIVNRVSRRDPLLRVAFSALNSGSEIPELLHHLGPIAEQVDELDLSNLSMPPDALANLPAMPRIRTLSLRSTGIPGEALIHLARLKSLESLNLCSTDVGDSALPHLAALPNLKKLYLFQTRVSRAGANELARSRPGLQVILGTEEISLGQSRSGDLTRK